MRKLCMDEEILKILEKKISEIKQDDVQINQITDTFSNLDKHSFSLGIATGRLFNSFFYQHRRILKRNPTEDEFEEFLKFLKNKFT